MMHRAHEMVLHAAAKAPGNPALILGSERLSYSDLVTRGLCIAGALAPYVRGKKNALVGIFMERSFHFFASVVGILCAGSCYVPVSTKYGDDRISYILGFAKPAVILAYEPFAERLVGLGLKSLDVGAIEYDGLPAVTAARDALAGKTPVAGDVDGKELAYVIFTSGTTCRPKGVMIEHRSLCNMMREKHDAYNMAPDDRLLQFYDVAFDGSIIDYMPTLSCGASLVLWTGEFDNAIKAATTQRTTHTMMTTSAMALFPVAPHWKLMTQGGEACPLELAVLWSAHCPFQNYYGPTEATGFVTWKQFERGEKALPIGHTVRESFTVVLDDEQNEVPHGTVGELCFGGACLGRGYWEDKEKTREKFINHPVHGKLYLSGDVGLIDEAGTEGAAPGDIFIRGRRDEQVKVRGVRIELQEVEQVLLENTKVSNAACAVTNDGVLLAFVTLAFELKATYDSDEPPDYEGDLLRLCKSRLAEQAVPSSIFLLRTFPRTASDKVDKRALVKTLDGDMQDMVEAATNELANALFVSCIKHDDGRFHAFVGIQPDTPSEAQRKNFGAYLRLRLGDRGAGVEWRLCVGGLPYLSKGHPLNGQKPRVFFGYAAKIRDRRVLSTGDIVQYDRSLDGSNTYATVPLLEIDRLPPDSGIIGVQIQCYLVPTLKVQESYWTMMELAREYDEKLLVEFAERSKQFVPFSQNPTIM
jgi:amino acid adenylation domain-containing protein